MCCRVVWIEVKKMVKKKKKIERYENNPQDAGMRNIRNGLSVRSVRFEATAAVEICAVPRLHGANPTVATLNSNANKISFVVYHPQSPPSTPSTIQHLPYSIQHIASSITAISNTNTNSNVNAFQIIHNTIEILWNKNIFYILQLSLETNINIVLSPYKYFITFFSLKLCQI